MWIPLLLILWGSSQTCSVVSCAACNRTQHSSAELLWDSTPPPLTCWTEISKAMFKVWRWNFWGRAWKKQAWLEPWLSVHWHVPCPHRSFCAHLPGRAAIPEPVPTVFLPAVINKEPAVGPIVFQRRERERITSWRWYYSSLRARVPPDVPVTAPDAPWQTAPLTALRAAGAERPPSRRRLTPFRDFRWREAQCGRDGGAGAEVRCRRLPRQGAERAAAGAAGEEARGRQRGGSAAPRAAVGTLRSPLGCRCRGCRAAGVPRAPDKMEALSAPRAPGRWRGGGCSPGAGFLAVRSCPGEERGGRGRAVS